MVSPKIKYMIEDITAKDDHIIYKDLEHYILQIVKNLSEETHLQVVEITHDHLRGPVSDHTPSCIVKQNA